MSSEPLLPSKLKVSDFPHFIVGREQIEKLDFHWMMMI